MAKKEKESSKTSSEEFQKRIEKYYKAQESEKRGKSLAASIIGTAVLCFIILLIVILKMSGVGKTVVFTTDESGKVQTSIADAADVSATNLAGYVGDKIMDKIEENK